MARIALVHDWLTGMRGGEKVLAAILGMFPDAHLFTLIHRPGACDALVHGRRIFTTPLNRLPGIHRYYRSLLPIFPLAVHTLDCRDYDLVISSSHCVAKGVRVSPGTPHVCYCHTPMRYIWHQAAQYERRMSALARPIYRIARPMLRAWDRRSSQHVSQFVANSNCVANRIHHVYGRESTVVYPPVDTAFYTPASIPREDYYLIVSSLVPYKCIDHAVDAFRGLPHALRIIGSGPMLPRLRHSAPTNVTFLAWQSDHTIRDHYRRCRALLFPGEEDFGIVPVEAMACGAPVIAFRGGGALETVRDIACAREATGLLYSPQSPDGLRQAILYFEQIRDRFVPEHARCWAQRFGRCHFAGRFSAICDAVISDRT